MSYDDEELKEIKRDVDRKLWRWGLLGVNFVAWLVGSAIVAALDPAAVEIVAPAWFGLIILHGLLVFLWIKRDHDIEAEVERRAQVRGSEKLKRDRLYRLADDGELVEVEDTDEDYAPLKDIHR
ncbi:MAG: hypothetical protein ABI970_16055 [Chloroflexota bacterium]